MTQNNNRDVMWSLPDNLYLPAASVNCWHLVKSTVSQKTMEKRLLHPPRPPPWGSPPCWVRTSGPMSSRCVLRELTSLVSGLWPHDQWPRPRGCWVGHNKIKNNDELSKLNTSPHGSRPLFHILHYRLQRWTSWHRLRNGHCLSISLRKLIYCQVWVQVPIHKSQQVKG